MSDLLKFRSVDLVRSLVAAVYESAAGEVLWIELVDRFSGERWSWKTVEGALNDLVAFGALHKVGKGGRGKVDRRVVRGTVLGAGWWRDGLPGLRVVDSA